MEKTKEVNNLNGVDFEKQAFGIKDGAIRVRIAREQFCQWHRDNKNFGEEVRVTKEDFSEALRDGEYDNNVINNIMTSYTGPQRRNTYPYLSADQFVVLREDGSTKEAFSREYREYCRGNIAHARYVEDYANVLRLSQYPYMRKYIKPENQTDLEMENIGPMIELEIKKDNPLDRATLAYSSEDIQDIIDKNANPNLETKFLEKTGFSEMPLYTEDQIFDSAKKIFEDEYIDSKGIFRVLIGTPRTTGVSSDGWDMVNPELEQGLELYYSSDKQARDGELPKIIRVVERGNYNSFTENTYRNGYPNGLGTYRLMEDGNYINTTSFDIDENGNLIHEIHTFDELVNDKSKEKLTSIVEMMGKGIDGLLSEEEYNMIMAAKDVAPEEFRKQYDLLERAHKRGNLTLEEIGRVTVESLKENPEKEDSIKANLERDVAQMVNKEVDSVHREDKGE